MNNAHALVICLAVRQLFYNAYEMQDIDELNHLFKTCGLNLKLNKFTDNTEHDVHKVWKHQQLLNPARLSIINDGIKGVRIGLASVADKDAHWRGFIPINYDGISATIEDVYDPVRMNVEFTDHFNEELSNLILHYEMIELPQYASEIPQALNTIGYYVGL